MVEGPTPQVAIVDYGMGNLFSVKHACQHVGLHAEISADAEALWAADGVILPGVGAYGDAMQALRQSGLVEPLQEIAISGKLMVGICLGFQLFMSESEEFGYCEGLNIIPGRVVRFKEPEGFEGRLKVPQVGWNRIFAQGNGDASAGVRGGAERWDGGLLSGLENGTHMYFVHSFYVIPEDSESTLATSRYGQIDFCAGIQQGNVVGMQFHPERSGSQGLRIYDAIRVQLMSNNNK
jgi:imidazole glycerol-phosphate synthase subunit HisH